MEKEAIRIKDSRLVCACCVTKTNMVAVLYTDCSLSLVDPVSHKIQKTFYTTQPDIPPGDYEKYAFSSTLVSVGNHFVWNIHDIAVYFLKTGAGPNDEVGTLEYIANPSSYFNPQIMSVKENCFDSCFVTNEFDLLDTVFEPIVKQCTVLYEKYKELLNGIREELCLAIRRNKRPQSNEPYPSQYKFYRDACGNCYFIRKTHPLLDTTSSQQVIIQFKNKDEYKKFDAKKPLTMVLSPLKVILPLPSHNAAIVLIERRMNAFTKAHHDVFIHVTPSGDIYAVTLSNVHSISSTPLCVQNGRILNYAFIGRWLRQSTYEYQGKTLILDTSKLCDVKTIGGLTFYTLNLIFHAIETNSKPICSSLCVTVYHDTDTHCTTFV